MHDLHEFIASRPSIETIDRYVQGMTDSELIAFVVVPGHPIMTRSIRGLDVHNVREALQEALCLYIMEQVQMYCAELLL